MKPFVYIITEGILDVVVLTSVLSRSFGFNVIQQKSKLPQLFEYWLNSFKWPVGEDVSRRSVPAPAFLESDSMLVGIRSAQGLKNIAKTIAIDQEVFLKPDGKQPVVIGVVLDADDEGPQKRFEKFAELLSKAGYPRPATLDGVTETNNQRSGIFAFPGLGVPGTIESVLVPLARNRFPDLHKFVSTYVDEWCRTDMASPSPDHDELRKPSGPLKATLSSMVAFLKPAKPLNASIEDHKWLPADPRACTELQPLVEFLEKLLAPIAVADTDSPV